MKTMMAGLAVGSMLTMVLVFSSAALVASSISFRRVTHANVTCNSRRDAAALRRPACQGQRTRRARHEDPGQQAPLPRRVDALQLGPLARPPEREARSPRRTGVDAGQDTTVEHLDLTLHHRQRDKANKFKYRMEGKFGGCNSGLVGSWAGDITLVGTKKT